MSARGSSISARSEAPGMLCRADVHAASNALIAALAGAYERLVNYGTFNGGLSVCSAVRLSYLGYIMLNFIVDVLPNYGSG